MRVVAAALMHLKEHALCVKQSFIAFQKQRLLIPLFQKWRKRCSLRVGLHAFEALRSQQAHENMQLCFKVCPPSFLHANQEHTRYVALAEWHARDPNGARQGFPSRRALSAVFQEAMVPASIHKV